MATFLEIQTRVRTRLIDLPTAVLEEVPDLVTKAHREIQRRHNFKIMEAEFETATTVGVRTLNDDIPSDFKELRDRPFITEDTGFTRELILAPSRAALLRKYEVDDEGAPKAILDPVHSLSAASAFEVWPLPDGLSDYDDGEYVITIPYWRWLTEPVEDADTDWFTQNAEWYLTFKATAEGFMVDWDEERATLWEQKATNELSQLLLADKNSRLMHMDTWVPYRDVFEPQLKD